MTINQVKMWIIYKNTGQLYKTLDDLRPHIDPKFLVKQRHSGSVYRFYQAKAKSLGRDNEKDFNSFMINEMSQH